jgi:carbonic anhydrase
MRYRLFSFVPTFVLALALVLTGCQSGSDSSSSTAESDTQQEAAAESVTMKWGYTGDTGPSNWASLDDAYEACAGQSQSPIDLAADDEAQDATEIQFDYSAAQGTLLDTGHGVQVNVEGGTLTIGGKAFALKQFHFHTPSEHTLNGESYPAEVHLVHAADDGELAVLGIFYEEGDANDFLAPVWDEMGSKADLQDSDPMEVNVANMLPSDRVTYTYSGSLTTPPCSEVVRWHVMQEPLTMSAEQLEALTSIYDGNNRPVQPLNDREIDRVTL